MIQRSALHSVGSAHRTLWSLWPDATNCPLSHHALVQLHAYLLAALINISLGVSLRRLTQEQIWTLRFGIISKPPPSPSLAHSLCRHRDLGDMFLLSGFSNTVFPSKHMRSVIWYVK